MTVQILGSAYALGASSEQLKVTYEHEVTTLVNIDDTFVRGDKITKENWRDFINQKPFVRRSLARRNALSDGFWIGTL